MELVVALVMLALGFALWLIYERLFKQGSPDWSRLAESVRFDFFAGSEVQWPMMRVRSPAIS